MLRISCQRVWFRRALLSVILPLIGACALLGSGQPAAAQPGRGVAGLGGRTVPTKSYHAAFVDFYDGDYRSALVQFQTEARLAIKTASRAGSTRSATKRCRASAITRWECTPRPWPITRPRWRCIRHFPAWLSQVALQPIRADLTSPKPPPWQVRKLQAPSGQLPPTMLLGQGQIDVSGTIQQGGVVQQANLYPIEPQEIIRCTALAIRRRGELLGPLAAHDAVLDNVIAALQARPGQLNHWSVVVDQPGTRDGGSRQAGVPPQRFRSYKRPRWHQANSNIR